MNKGNEVFVKFESYLEVQESGLTNMFDIKVVSELSGLDKNEIMFMMKNYEQLKSDYDNIKAQERLEAENCEVC